jgi:hypothetical protein
MSILRARAWMQSKGVGYSWLMGLLMETVLKRIGITRERNRRDASERFLRGAGDGCVGVRCEIMIRRTSSHSELMVSGCIALLTRYIYVRVETSVCLIKMQF